MLASGPGIWPGKPAAFFYAGISFSSPPAGDLLCRIRDIRQVFSEDAVRSGASHTASLWLDLARGRLRLDCLSRNGAGSTFFPWAAPIPREARKSHLRHPPLRFGPRAGAASIASGLSIAIEAAMVAGSKQPGRSDMATIGSFKKVGSEWQGEIVTLSVQTKGVRVVPEPSRISDNAPSHRVFVGRAEIGAAWSRVSNEGRDYLAQAR